MKKGISVMVLAAVIAAGGLFAEGFSVSAGVGGFIGSDFGGGGIEYEYQSIKATSGLPYFGGGGFLFLDATYAELDLGIFAGGGKMKTTYDGKEEEADDDTSILSFNIGLLLKYPFAITEQFSFFPLLGAEFPIVLSYKTDDEEYKNKDGDDAPGDASALWFKLGVGADFEFIPKLYGRLEALYGIRLASKMETDYVDAYKDYDAKTRLGHGLTVKLAIGYKFF